MTSLGQIWHSVKFGHSFFFFFCKVRLSLVRLSWLVLDWSSSFNLRKRQIKAILRVDWVTLEKREAEKKKIRCVSLGQIMLKSRCESKC